MTRRGAFRPSTSAKHASLSAVAKPSRGASSPKAPGNAIGKPPTKERHVCTDRPSRTLSTVSIPRPVVYGDSRVTLPGTGRPSAACGTPYGVRRQTKRGAQLRQARHACTALTCPTCADFRLEQFATQVVVRLRRFEMAAGRRFIYHSVMVSPPEGRRNIDDLAWARARVAKYIRDGSVAPMYAHAKCPPGDHALRRKVAMAAMRSGDQKWIRTVAKDLWGAFCMVHTHRVKKERDATGRRNKKWFLRAEEFQRIKREDGVGSKRWFRAARSAEWTSKDNLHFHLLVPSYLLPAVTARFQAAGWMIKINTDVHFTTSGGPNGLDEAQRRFIGKHGGRGAVRKVRDQVLYLVSHRPVWVGGGADPEAETGAEVAEWDTAPAGAGDPASPLSCSVHLDELVPPPSTGERDEAPSRAAHPRFVSWLGCLANAVLAIIPDLPVLRTDEIEPPVSVVWVGGILAGRAPPVLPTADLENRHGAWVECPADMDRYVMRVSELRAIADLSVWSSLWPAVFAWGDDAAIRSVLGRTESGRNWLDTHDHERIACRAMLATEHAARESEPLRDLLPLENLVG